MFYHKLSNVQNVAANDTAHLPDMPRGMTYLGVLFKLGGTFTKALMTEIRAKLDTKPFVRVAGSHLDAQNLYMKIPVSTTLMPLMFADFKARSNAGEAQGAIDTSVGYGNFSMEVDIGAATSPTLQCWAILAPPLSSQDPNKRTIRAILKNQETFAASGEYTLAVSTGSRAGALIDKTFHHHGGNVTKMSITKDGLYLVKEADTDVLDYISGIKDTRAAQTNLVVFDPHPNDNISDTISTLRSDGTKGAFEFNATLSAADTITSYSHLQTTIENV